MQSRAGGEIKAPAVLFLKDAAAHFFSLANDLETIPLARLKIAFTVRAAVAHHDDAHLFADVTLNIAGKKPLILSEGEPLRIVIAVIGAFEGGKLFSAIRSFQKGAIILHGGCHVFGTAHSALYLEGDDARRNVLFNILADGKVGEGERVGFFLVTRPIVRIFFATGLFTPTAIAAVAARKTGQIALSGKTGAERALNERFRFHEGRDLFDFLYRRFAGEDHAGKAVFFGEPRPVKVVGARLRGEVQYHLRILFVQIFADKDILQNNRVRAHVVRFHGGL